MNTRLVRGQSADVKRIWLLSCYKQLCMTSKEGGSVAFWGLARNAKNNIFSNRNGELHKHKAGSSKILLY